MCEQSNIRRLRKVAQRCATVAFTVALLALGFLSTGCAHFQTPIKPAASLSPDTAIIYGRFYGLAPGFGSSDVANAIALRLRNVETQREYLVGFRLTNSPYIPGGLYYPPTNHVNPNPINSVVGIAVTPGRYAIDGYLTTLFGHFKLKQISFPTTTTFDCRPNSATYIGDFKSSGHTLPSGTEEWGLYGVTNNFAETTKQFQAHHQKLSPAAFTCATETLKTFETNPKIYEQKIYLVPPDNSYDYTVILPVTCNHH